MNSKQERIVELTGADDWQDVVAAFDELNVDEIGAEIDRMFPNDENAELAQDIFDELN